MAFPSLQLSLALSCVMGLVMFALYCGEDHSDKLASSSKDAVSLISSSSLFGVIIRFAFWGTELCKNPPGHVELTAILQPAWIFASCISGVLLTLCKCRMHIVRSEFCFMLVNKAMQTRRRAFHLYFVFPTDGDLLCDGYAARSARSARTVRCVLVQRRSQVRAGPQRRSTSSFSIKSCTWGCDSVWLPSKFPRVSLLLRFVNNPAPPPPKKNPHGFG